MVKDPKTPSQRNKRHYYKRKPPSKKIVDRITYDPNKHKQSKARNMRKKLQEQPIQPQAAPKAPPAKIKLGSFNVNGLDVESSWAVQQLLQSRGFDVSCHKLEI